MQLSEALEMFPSDEIAKRMIEEEWIPVIDEVRVACFSGSFLDTAIIDRTPMLMIVEPEKDKPKYKIPGGGHDDADAADNVLETAKRTGIRELEIETGTAQGVVTPEMLRLIHLKKHPFFGHYRAVFATFADFDRIGDRGLEDADDGGEVGVDVYKDIRFGDVLANNVDQYPILRGQTDLVKDAYKNNWCL